MIDFSREMPIEGDLDVRWIHGAPPAKHSADAAIQVHWYDEHTVILRQSKAVNFEGPFLYLLFGNHRALLLDTGATADPELFPLRQTVDGLISDWLSAHPRTSYDLVVAHTHAHGDHVAADGQFVDRQDTTVAGKDLQDVQAFFGFTAWPEEVVKFDLGGRTLEISGIPGHHETSIAIFDAWTGFLLTGDSVYPGRLYARDFPQFQASMERLVSFAAARPITHVMGCHIEMTSRPGRDYPLGATYQPDEPPLQMAVAQLTAVRDAARAVNHRPGIHAFDDFIIWNGTCKRQLPGQIRRAFLYRISLRYRALLARLPPRTRS